MYYATLEHNSTIDPWRPINAATLIEAKRRVTRHYGQAYTGQVIYLVECSRKEYQSGRINDLPAYFKLID